MQHLTVNRGSNCFVYILELNDDDSVLEGNVGGRTADDEATFYVKYLGSTLIDETAGQKATADAIKTIVATVSPATIPPRGLERKFCESSQNSNFYGFERVFQTN